MSLRGDERKYSNFATRIDVDAFEEAISYEVLYQKENSKSELEDIGHCPDPWEMHKTGDSTGKFAINREKRMYNCWVCGGGTLLSLAMAVNDFDEQEALEWLYQFTKVEEQTDDDFVSEIEAILHIEKKSKPVWPYFNANVTNKWETNTRGSQEFFDFVTSRGISLYTASLFRLGYDAEATRLAPLRDGMRKAESYTGPSIIFPHTWGERLVGWQQRWLDDDRPKWIPKYTNTGDFPKNETIFNYERVYLSEHPIVVVESVPTVLFLHTLGIPAVATFGSSVTDEQMRLLRKCQQGLIIAPDNDDPGRKWLGYTEGEVKYRKDKERKVLAQYLSRFVPVKITEFVGEEGEGNDLGDLADEPQEVLRLVAEAAYFE